MKIEEMKNDKNKLEKVKKLLTNHKYYSNTSFLLATFLMINPLFSTTSEKNYVQSKFDLEDYHSTDLETQKELFLPIIKKLFNEDDPLILKMIDKIEIDLQEKEQIILEKYQLTKEQFDTITACVLAEAKSNSYEDTYAVINTIYNRTKSWTWKNYVDSIMGENTGSHLYYQCICPGQFVVYESGQYQKFLAIDKENSLQYQAIIDFLYTEEPMHQFLSFRSAENDTEERTQFVEDGNCYFNELTEEDRIPVETTPTKIKCQKKSLILMK